MIFRAKQLLMALIFLLLIVAPSLAETRYVVDQLVVNLRDSKGAQYNTVKNLKTGTPLEILEEDQRFVKVRIESGEEGYILKQYVTKKTPSPIIIARLEREQARLQKEVEQLRTTMGQEVQLKNSAEDELSELDKALAKSRQELKTLSKKYEDLRYQSEHIVQLAEEKDTLEAEHGQLSQEVQVLREENASFHRSNAVRWFLAGGGVFFFGWLIGKISRKSRRDSFYR